MFPWVLYVLLTDPAQAAGVPERNVGTGLALMDILNCTGEAAVHPWVSV
jgi:hypothetical protein